MVAARVCAAVSGAGSAERGHKEMAFLLTKGRNRMQWPKTEKMMYVRINENLLRKRQRVGYRVDVANALDLGGEEEEEDGPPLPSAWREAEEAEEGRRQRLRRNWRSAPRAARRGRRVSLSPSHAAARLRRTPRTRSRRRARGALCGARPCLTFEHVIAQATSCVGVYNARCNGALPTQLQRRL